MNSSVVNSVADEILCECINELMLEDSLELMWCIRTNNISLDDLYSLVPLNNLLREERVVAKPVVSSSYSATIFCPMCNEQVAGVRFAPHLEKCMNGGKRGSRKYNDALFDDSLYKLPTKPKVSEIPDPHPSSLIVRVRLKQGVPYGNTRRIGVSLEDFNSGTVGRAAAVAALTTSAEIISTANSQRSIALLNGGGLNGAIKDDKNNCKGESL